MKYVITDQGEVALGHNTFHQILGEKCKGKVIAAGHCRLVDTKYEVYGESIGYGIQSKPEDADFINSSSKVVIYAD